MLYFNVIVRQVMTGSSERIFWYLFNGFLHVDNFVMGFFPPAKMLEMSPRRWCHHTRPEHIAVLHDVVAVDLGEDPPIY